VHFGKPPSGVKRAPGPGANADPPQMLQAVWPPRVIGALGATGPTLGTTVITPFSPQS
jgi:hypothetical protein